MSYAVSAALQSAVFQALTGDATLTGLVGSAIYDAVPSGDLPTLYVSLGGEVVTDASDGTGRGALHKFTLSVVSDAPGFARAKEVAGAICDVLVDADLTLSRGRLSYLNFDRASATRTNTAEGRKIDLRFAARVDDI